MLRAIKYIAIGLLLSFVYLAIATLNFDKDLGIIVWGMASSFTFYGLYKRWQHLRMLENIEAADQKFTSPHTKLTEKYDDEDPLDHLDDYRVNPRTNEPFKPWTEEDLLWSGKRKLKIEYRDRNGNITERPIVIYGIWPNSYGEICFRAYCELRQDWRTFYGDRVLAITDARQKEYDDFFDYMSEALKI